MHTVGAVSHRVQLVAVLESKNTKCTRSFSRSTDEWHLEKKFDLSASKQSLPFVVVVSVVSLLPRKPQNRYKYFHFMFTLTLQKFRLFV